MKYTLLFISLVFSFTTFADSLKVFDTTSNSYISYSEFIEKLPTNGHIILGEFHNTQSIQSAQAKIITDKVLKENAVSEFHVHWEFLNWTDQNNIDDSFGKLVKGLLSTEEFLGLTAGAQNLTYAPIIESTVKLDGKLYGLNLPRSIKKKVMDGGINSVDPRYIPASHYVGGANYLDRFTEAMGGHAPTHIIEKYFLAQCLTDSTMANQIALNEHSKLNFTIAGSFHTDFFDGTVIRLEALSNSEITTVKLVSESNSSEEELNYYLSSTPKYGYHSHYIVITK